MFLYKQVPAERLGGLNRFSLMGKPLLGLILITRMITIIKIILSTNFDDLIIEISDIIILIIQISFRKTDLWFYYFRKLSFLYFRLFF